jgi:hypothetical protein
MMRRRTLLAAGTVALGTMVVPATTSLPGAPAAAASENSGTVRDWNAHALAALANPPTAAVPGAGLTPPVTAINMAMVQGAVYDAVNSIDRGHQPYLAGLPPAPPTASLDAAVATAAHHLLVGIGGGAVPPLPQVVRDRLDALYAAELAEVTDGPAEDQGIAAGAAAASAMLAARANDGRYGPFRFTVGDDPGEWRPALPAFVNDPNAWVARVTPFTLESQSQFQTNGPRRLAGNAYAREYNEVKSLGAVNSVRTPEQEAVVRFFNVSPVELLNRTFRTISASEGLSLIEDARLFAMANVATADTLINCWSDKAHFSFWRPITAIQEGNNDGNPRTAGDTGWLPLEPTPPYPDHTSGYNCVSGAMTNTAKHYFGTNRMNFSLVRIVPGVPNLTRTYRHFTAVVGDTIDARVWQGLHFRSADEQGAKLGKDVANWVSTNFFQPVS